jgi:hypothetical protein
MLAMVVLLGGPLARLAAADVETRDFHIFVDDKYAGSYRMKIDSRDDGTVHVTGNANVTVKKLFYTYTYTYIGTETWKGNRLLHLDSKCNDDGKQFAVTVTAEGNNLRVKVNGQERISRPDVWTTTYWRLPDARFRNGPVPLLDCDTGKAIDGRMHYVGISQVNVGGQPINCPHYHLTAAKLDVELWYDAQNRLVREVTIEDGHKTLIHLAKIQR